MLFGVNYEESLAACVIVVPSVLHYGMSWSEARKAARKLGGETKLLRRGRYDVEEDTGLLNVRKSGHDHAVFLWAGRVIEGNGEMWERPADYFAHYKYQPYSLLVRIT